jgi:DNA uptake protein ComE-like DNA-binding protein
MSGNSLLMIFRQVREYFIFTRRERNGLLVLVFILILVVSIDFVFPYLISPESCAISGLKTEAGDYYDKSGPDIVPEEVPFTAVFDPNAVNPGDLMKLGVPTVVAGNWIRYLQKGGKFKRKDEVRKLYGMNDELYNSLADHINIKVQAKIPKSITGNSGGYKQVLKEDCLQENQTNRSIAAKRDVVLVEINRADSVQLESLPGIGPVLASRILKYRNLIGGFYEVSQLKDIYGMKEELWMKSSSRICVDTSAIKKLKINFMTLSELGRHPYVGFRAARKIVNQRDLHGKFSRKEELEALFSPDSLRRLLPYIGLGDGVF